jgi:molybdate transport system ATP-binding protein
MLVDVEHQQGAFNLTASFEVSEGVTALFGASGSGKTTLVQILAGLTRPTKGVVRFGDTIWNDTATGLFVPPHKRRIGYVFQESRLFPHLTARQNLLYGRFFAPRSARRIGEREVVELLGIGRLLANRPSTLSGGERQRIAIGRALLADPELILMDEPLSALDRSRKTEILPYIERIRDEFRIPIIYVSHALEEVARLSTRIVLLDEGRVKAVGAPADVLAGMGELSEPSAPQSILTARLIGHEPAYGVSMAEIHGNALTLQAVDLGVGTAVRLRISANDVVLSLDRPEGVSALNILPCTVRSLKPDGRQALVTLDCGGQTLLSRITLLSAERLHLIAGQGVYAVFKTMTVDSTSVYQAVTGG